MRFNRRLPAWWRLGNPAFGRSSDLELLLRRGASGAFLIQVGSATLGMISHVIMARMLGASQYGAFALTLNWLNVLAICSLFGQDTAVVRLLPGYIQQHAMAAAGLRHWAWWMVLVVSLTLTAGAIAATAGLRLGGETLESTLLAGWLGLPLLSLLQLSGAFHRGLKRAVSAGLFTYVLRPVFLIAAMLALHAIIPKAVSAPVALLTYVAATVIALFASESALTRAWPAISGSRCYDPRNWTILGGRFLLFSVITVVLNRLDVLVLGALAGADEVGPYFAVVQLATTAAYGLNAVNTILAPLIAQEYRAGNHEQLTAIVRRAASLSFGVTVLVSMPLALIGPWVLALFGTGFSEAYGPLLVILAGQCVNAAVGPVGCLMTMTRFEREAPYIFGAGAVLNLILSVILIPRMGMMGAAIATSVAMICWNLAGLVFVRRQMAINTTVFPM